MRRILLLLVILTIAVFCSACINNYAVQQLNQKAKKYSDQGDLASAASRLESSVDLDGNVFESRFNLAVTYIDMRQCEKALEQINAAMAISSKDAAVYYVNGMANSCLADKITYDTDEKGTRIKREYEGAEAYSKAREYVQYLKDANSAFSKYLELAPVTDQTKEIAQRIEINNNEITTYTAEYGL